MSQLRMRSANIAELRDKLTQYSREVPAGDEIVPLPADDEADDAALVAAGLMRKAQRPLPAAFWRTRRRAVSIRAAAATVSEDRVDSA